MKIDNLLDKLKSRFDFLKNYNLKILSEEIFNKSKPESQWVRIIYSNEKNREIIVEFYPKEIYKISFDISNSIKVTYGTFGLKQYLNFKAGNEPKFIPMEKLDKNNFDQALRDYAAKIEFLLENELKEIVNGNEWIDIPSYDPREQK